MANRKILHKRTRNNKPTSGMLSYGEIAMNYGADKEALYIKSSKDKIVEFKTDDYNEKIFFRNDNKVFTTFETEAEYNAAVASGEIVAPNTSYIVQTKKIKSLSREITYEWNVKVVITQEWLNYWDAEMTSKGVDHIYLCEFYNYEWITQNPDYSDDFKYLSSNNITSFIVNGIEHVNDFTPIPANIANNSSMAPNDDNERVGYAIPRNEVNIGDIYYINVTIVSEVFSVRDTYYGFTVAFDLFNIVPVYSFNMTEQLQSMLTFDEYTLGIWLFSRTNVHEIKYSGDCKLSIELYTENVINSVNGWQYTPHIYEYSNPASLHTEGKYIEYLKGQEEIGVSNPSLTVYLPTNNPTYGSPSDIWDGSTDQGKTMWGVHNYYLKNKWNQSDFQHHTVDGPNLVAWKSNYTFNVVGYEE